MDKISINFLPSEYSVSQKKKDKWSIVQTLSVAFFLLLIFLTSVVVALRVLQSQNITQAKKQTEESETKITSFKSREATLAVLKNRVEAINQILKKPSKQTDSYHLANETFSTSIIIDSLTIDQNGNIVATATIPSNDLLVKLLSSLEDKLASAGIHRVEIESLSRGRDGTYRAILSLKLSG